MKLAVASLIRDEIDIIGAFLQHLVAEPLTVDPARLVANSLRNFQIEQEATGARLMLEGNRLRLIPQENLQ